MHPMMIFMLVPHDNKNIIIHLVLLYANMHMYVRNYAVVYVMETIVR